MHQHGQQDEDLQRGREFPHRIDATDVDPSDERDDQQRNHIVLPSGEPGQIEAEVIGELHGVYSTQQKRRAPVPPAGEKSPEVAEGRARPAIEAAFDRHGGSEFRGNERDGNRPEERNHQQVDQSQAGAGGGDHVLEAEGAAGAVREHDPDEIEEAGFTDGGFGAVVGGHGSGRCAPIIRGELWRDFLILPKGFRRRGHKGGLSFSSCL